MEMVRQDNPCQYIKSCFIFNRTESSPQQIDVIDQHGLSLICHVGDEIDITLTMVTAQNRHVTLTIRLNVWSELCCQEPTAPDLQTMDYAVCIISCIPAAVQQVGHGPCSSDS